MENNVFEDLLPEDGANQNEVDFDHSFDLGVDDFVDGNTETTTLEENNTEEEPNTSEEDLNPTNQAFAQMRTENKQFSEKISELEAIVKQAGLKDIDEFIAKAKESQIKRDAKQKGIDPLVAQEIAEMKSLKESIVAEREKAAKETIERNFVSNVDSFIKANKLSEKAVDKLSQDLEKDGLSIDSLMTMPKNALNKILSSYVDTDYQKNLERKENIRKEMPINQTSKIDTVSLNKEIDSLARALANK